MAFTQYFLNVFGSFQQPIPKYLFQIPPFLSYLLTMFQQKHAYCHCHGRRKIYCWVMQPLFVFSHGPCWLIRKGNGIRVMVALRLFHLGHSQLPWPWLSLAYSHAWKQRLQAKQMMRNSKITSRCFYTRSLHVLTGSLEKKRKRLK